jgi:hypothetical protein
MARAAAESRARFTESVVLRDLDTCLNTTKASMNKVKVLQESSGTIGLGLVKLPSLAGLTIDPKGGNKAFRGMYCILIGLLLSSFSCRIS